MSGTVSPQVKLKLLCTLAENSGKWIPTTQLASSVGSRGERIQGTLTHFVNSNFVQTLDWEHLTKEERKEFEKNYTKEISSTTKTLYKLDLEGWKTLQKSFQDCFGNQNMSDILNIPNDIKEKLSLSKL